MIKGGHVKKYSAFLFTPILLLLVGYFILASNTESAVETNESIRYLSPGYLDIASVVTASGKVEPREEVEIKAQISGVIETLFVEPGEYVKRGQKIAKIRLIPSAERLNSAIFGLETATINLQNSEKRLDQYSHLYERKLISRQEYDDVLREFELNKKAYDSAQKNLQLVREGGMDRGDMMSNIVTSTIDGMILDIPVKRGAFVTETNTFNAGTTIASVADIEDMIFNGKVDEGDVGRLRQGLQASIMVNALEEQVFDARLEFVSPKGFVENGITRFPVRASVTLAEGTFLRAGYSASAEIVVEKKESVLAIPEYAVQYSSSSYFVNLLSRDNVVTQQNITIGVSNGTSVEIKSGITIGDKVVVNYR